MPVISGSGCVQPNEAFGYGRGRTLTQAPRFYERRGYEEFGRVEFRLPSHARDFLRKSLE